jgi:hypothetical protein
MRTVLAPWIASQSFFWVARSFGRWVRVRCMKILDLWCYNTVLLLMSQTYFLYFVNFCSLDSARRRAPPGEAPDMFWRCAPGVLVSAVTNGILFLIYPCHFRCWITSAVYLAPQNNKLSRHEPLSAFSTILAVAAAVFKWLLSQRMSVREHLVIASSDYLRFFFVVEWNRVHYYWGHYWPIVQAPEVDDDVGDVDDDV